MLMLFPFRIPEKFFS